MSQPVLGYIRVARKGKPIKGTEEHQKNLETLGYAVRRKGDDLVVECAGIYTGKVDLLDKDAAKEFFKSELIERKRLLSYECTFRVRTTDGRILDEHPGHFCLSFLERFLVGSSCFMVKSHPSSAGSNTFDPSNLKLS